MSLKFYLATLMQWLRYREQYKQYRLKMSKYIPQVRPKRYRIVEVHRWDDGFDIEVQHAEFVDGTTGYLLQTMKWDAPDRAHGFLCEYKIYSSLSEAQANVETEIQRAREQEQIRSKAVQVLQDDQDGFHIQYLLHFP